MSKTRFEFFYEVLSNLEDTKAILFDKNLTVLDSAGALSDDVIGSSLEALFSGSTLEIQKNFCNLALKGIRNLVNVDIGGEIFRCKFFPYQHIKGKVSKAILIYKNISEQVNSKILAEEKEYRLIEIAFQNSHHTRAPLARILGIIEAIKGQEQVAVSDELLSHLYLSAKELDEIVHQINENTES